MKCAAIKGWILFYFAVKAAKDYFLSITCNIVDTNGKSMVKKNIPSLLFLFVNALTHSLSIIKSNNNFLNSSSSHGRD